MSDGCKDTHLLIEAMRLELLKNTPPWRKLQLMAELNAAAQALAMSGLRTRHLHASDAELRRRLAGLLLGEETAARIYGT